MKSLMKYGGLVVALALLAGCASTPGRGTYEERSLPNGVAQVRKPAPGRSMVVFVRPGSLAYALGFNIFDNGKAVGHVRSNSYCQYECAPGKHVFAVAHENFSFVDADLLPDRIYYVKTASTMGWWSSRTAMWPLYPGCEGGAWEDLPKWLGDVTEVTVTPALQEWQARGSESIMRKYNAYYEPWSRRADRKMLRPEYGVAEPIRPID